jgi:hypothetical protein
MFTVGGPPPGGGGSLPGVTGLLRVSFRPEENMVFHGNLLVVGRVHVFLGVVVSDVFVRAPSGNTEAEFEGKFRQRISGIQDALSGLPQFKQGGPVGFEVFHVGPDVVGDGESLAERSFFTLMMD